MNEPTEAQIKEFWEKIGFEPHDFYDETWSTPDKKTWVDLPPIDFNNLFKYAVPKLNKKDNDLYDIRFTFNRPNGGVTCDINREEDITQAQGKDPALALFWAIWEVIHE